MFKNYIKIAWRNLLKRKVFTAINIVGLAIGFGSSILIYLFLNFHISHDNFHKNSDRIYRLITDISRDEVEYEPTVPPGFAKVFKEEYSYADKVAKIVDQDALVLRLNKDGDDVKFKKDISFVEADFFKIFNFPLLNGSDVIPITNPNTAVVTEEAALNLFGKTDVVGKTFVLENDKTIEITGVLKNFPKATFLKNQIFISFKNLEDHFEFAAGEFWGGTTSNLQAFALLKENQNIANIEDVFKEIPKK